MMTMTSLGTVHGRAALIDLEKPEYAVLPDSYQLLERYGARPEAVLNLETGQVVNLVWMPLPGVN